MTAPLTIALVCSAEGKGKDGKASEFECDLLRAALAAVSGHRFVIYPDTKATRAIVDETGAAPRVSFVKAVRKVRLPKRFWRRARGLVRRRAATTPSAPLLEALVKAGATCAWILTDSHVTVDLPYAAHIGDLRHRLHPWFPEVSANGTWRVREERYEEFVRRASVLVAGTRASAMALQDAYGVVAGGPEVVAAPTPVFALEAGWRARGIRPSDLPSRYLLYVAPFAAHKNHVTAVRAVAALGSGAAPPGLMLVGADEGTLEHVMAEAEALGVAGRVRIFGGVDKERLIALYEHAEALLHVSLFDAHDQSPLAAMALGCPVIAARVAGAEERIGDCGLLADPLDAAGYAAAVRTLRHDAPARGAMIERGITRAREWTPAQYAESVLGIIESRIAPVRALWK